eukprot:GAHX01000447.1.p1 GENE.GAHX01000447.1~~GAHX01000447.1.p1  ORF type:complete len:236 (-),score=42.54 GAHX01000447.1:65-772(-)
MDFNDLKHPKRCLLASEQMFMAIGYLSMTVTAIILIAAMLFLIQNYYANRLKKGTSSYRISLSFCFFALANVTGLVGWTIGKIRGKPLVRPEKWVVLDLSKLMPTCFAIAYLLTEACGRLSNVGFGIKRILKVTKCRRLFKDYLSGIYGKKSYELVCKWEMLNKDNTETMDVLDRPGLNKEEANSYIEKNLDFDSYDFMLTEAFNDFNLTYNFGGQIEADLTEEIELQKVKNKIN